MTDKNPKYIDMMKALNINVAGDFLVMASTLIHIKSRLLLPDKSSDFFPEAISRKSFLENGWR